jgi:predicted ATPase
MYGGVGVGKTMLMDLLVASAPPEFKVPIPSHSSSCSSKPLWPMSLLLWRPASPVCPSSCGPNQFSTRNCAQALNHKFKCAQLRRAHFHDFMLDVHARLQKHRTASDALHEVSHV